LTDKNNRPIRILYIADSTSVHTQRWLRYFADLGYDIRLITIGQKRQILPYVQHVINFERFYYGSPSFIPTLLKTRRLIRSIRPDILHAHFVHQYGWLGALSGFHPFVLTGWGTDIIELPYASRFKIGKWLTRYALKKADAVTVTSDAAKRKAVALGALPEKVTVIFWGVDTEKFRPDIDTRQVRSELNIPDGSPVILSNRSFAPLYNNDIIIEAMEEILVKYPAAVLILQNAGDVPGGEQPLKAKAEQMGILNSLRFLPSFDHDMLPPLYALADIYVSVPSWDAGPVSLKEAMACGCAPVISNVPGPIEWVRHDENGLVVPVRDPKKLARAVCRLLADPDMKDHFNVNNRKMILEHAGHASQMKQAEIIYQNLMSVPASGNL
jgi:L-malate glycosyltransferase